MDHGQPRHSSSSDSKTRTWVGDCPDAAEVARLVTAPEGDADATAFLDHASGCDRCGPLVAAAMSTDDEGEDSAVVSGLKTAGAEWQRQMAWRFARAQQAPRATSRRWIWGVAGTLAAAAAVFVAVRMTRGPASARPELQELVAAVNGDRTRPVEGRLTGGFAYGPPPTLQRGPGDQASPRVRIAEAKLDEAARAHDTPETQAALGVGLVAIGDLDKAIEALEEAVQERPGEAHFQTDLSAAYLARAQWRDRAEDWPRALAAAERAIKADPTLVEPYFNRALALEGLHLDEQAAEAWSAYQAVEKTPRWRDEAAERAKKLKQRSSAEVPRGNQEAREHIEDVLLAKWGAAVLAGRAAEAKQLLDEAETAAAALVSAGGDTMARDEIALIRRVSRQARTSALKALADGHALYGRARESFQADRLQQAADLMSRARVSFARTNSPYGHWASIYRAITLWVSGAGPAAVAETRVLAMAHIPTTYFNLRGRLEWTAAMALETIERYDIARDSLRTSVEMFSRGREIENLGANQAYLAAAEWTLGERGDAWRHEIDALSHLRALGNSQRRNAILLDGSFFSLGEDMAEVAMYFENLLLHPSQPIDRATGMDDAYLRRAQVQARLGNVNAGLADLELAGRVTASLQDERLRSRKTAEQNRTRAMLLDSADAAHAVEASNAALAYFQETTSPLRVAELLTIRANALESLNDVFGAERDLRDAIDALERARRQLTSPQDRVQAFEQQRRAFRALTELEAGARGDPDEALRAAERGRARTLLEEVGRDSSIPLDPVAASRELPADVAVVFFVTLNDRVLTWVLTNDVSAHFSAPLSLRHLQHKAHRVRTLVDSNADIAALVPQLADLFVQLVEPAIRAAGSPTTLIFIPDGPLAMIPFAAVTDRTGRPLMEAYRVAIAPSLATFLHASRRLGSFSREDVLAIGDGHDPIASGLPRLDSANSEAIEVGRIYPRATVLTGGQATKERLLAARRSIIHFAGHTVVNPEFPFYSRVLLAPDDALGDNGILLASDISREQFEGSAVVVLATCEGAGGRFIDGEGLISIGRTFLNAGVPSVIASLWAVSDASHTLILNLHRGLRNGADPATALRAAQLEFLKEHGLGAPVRAWGGFVALGGVSFTH